MKLRGLILTLTALLVLAGYSIAEEPAYVKVFVNGWLNINRLSDEGFEVDTCKAPESDGVFVYADSAERARLGAYGYQYEVIHAEANYPLESPFRAAAYTGGKATYDHYFNYVEMETLLNEVASTLNAKAADTAEVITIGNSEEGRSLIGIKISDNVSTEEMEPEVRLLGTHHGNEMISFMTLLYFLEELATNFDESGYEDWTELVNGCELWCIPVVNPDGVNDGFYHYTQADGYRNGNGSRYNANSVDLNRNYSYHWSSYSGGGSAPFDQSETAAVRDNHELNHYVISHSYHSGATCINYVWNYVTEGYPDNHPPANRDLIYELMEIYQDNIPPNPIYDYVITNGGDWYTTNGDTNDWSYGVWGDVDTTIELYGGFKAPYTHDPSEGQLDDICMENDESILQTMLAPLRYGMHGKVVVSTTDPTPVTGATVTVYDLPGGDESEEDWFCVNDPELGDFYFMLLPGTYDATCSADGYSDVDFQVTVPETGSTTFVTVYMDNGVAGEDGDTPSVPYEFSLAQNRPNPVSHSTVISFTLPMSAYATLDIFDIKGRKVDIVYEGQAETGSNDICYDTSHLANGVYLYRLTSDMDIATKKMLVNR